jgi:metal-sulfur cluster biosynthetic enzyme
MIDVTELGIVTEINLSHLVKAPCPIEVTELGIVTEAKTEQLKKA